MAKRLEKDVKKDIKQYLARIPKSFFFAVFSGGFTMPGIPDIVGLVRGRFVGIEVKAPGKKDNVTKAQQTVGDLILSAGGQWFVADDVKDVEDWYSVFNAQYPLPNLFVGENNG